MPSIMDPWDIPGARSMSFHDQDVGIKTRTRRFARWQVMFLVVFQVVAGHDLKTLRKTMGSG